MENDVSKQLGHMARYDDIQSRDLFNLESICTQAYVIGSLQKYNKMTTAQIHVTGIQVLLAPQGVPCLFLVFFCYLCVKYKTRMGSNDTQKK